MSNRHIVVAGVSGRLGRVVAQHFLDAGDRVSGFVRRRNSAAVFEDAADGDFRAYRVDLTNEDAVASVFGDASEAFGIPDAVIHTVGGWALTPFLESSLESWQALVDVNLTTTYLCFREAARLMQGRGGRLIAFGSEQGSEYGRAGQSAYSASKAAVEHLVQSIDREFEGTALMAFIISPSTILYDADSFQGGVSAADIAGTCEFLLTDAARSLRGSTLKLFGEVR